MTELTNRFDEALRYTHEVHRTQKRKGNGAPYLGHLLGVASIVIDDGGSEDEAGLHHSSLRNAHHPLAAGVGRDRDF